MSIIQDSTKTKKRKKKTKDLPLYEQYLADSQGSQVSSDVEVEETDLDSDYSVGMDINILIRQTVQNVIQSVCLEGTGRNVLFGDDELVCFAAAVKHNCSILSIQIKHLNVSDVSLLPLCESLKQHPALRALDLCGINTSPKFSCALKELVCCNPNIIFAGFTDSGVAAGDLDVIDEALQYNAMVCPDVSSNPFQLGLLRKLNAIEQQEEKYMRSLAPKPWMLNPPCHPLSVPSDEKPSTEKKKKLPWLASTQSKIGARLCANYLKGGCQYGSRCKYYHPEYTSVFSNAMKVTQYENQGGQTGGSTSSGISVSRLQSRLRPSNFTLVEHQLPSEPRPSIHYRVRHANDKPFIYALWLMSLTTVSCAICVLSFS